MQKNKPVLLNHKAQKQRGAVLMGGVIMLTLMTLIGLTSIKGAVMEEKMAGNNREKHRSFEVSEMTLSIADGHLVRQDDVLPFYAGTYSGANAPATNGLYMADTDTDIDTEPQPWQAHNSWETDSGFSLAVNDANVPAAVRFSNEQLYQLNTATPPRYMMGLQGEVELDGMDSSIPQKFFRFYLTAQAPGGISTITTTLQTEALRAY